MSVTVFDKVWVWVQDYSEQKEGLQALAYVPLGFVVPWDGTKAKQKQIETARNWAGSKGKDLGEHSNEPVTGFRVSDSVRRYGYNGSGNVVWRMVDPRGWEFEIPSENMAQIIMSCGISENGVIPRPCIYGRSGARNVLLPEGTEHFKKSVNVKDVKKAKSVSKIKVADLKYGDVVTGPNLYSEIYLGKVKVSSKDKKLDGKVYHLFGKFYEHKLVTYSYSTHSYEQQEHFSFTIIKEPMIDKLEKSQEMPLAIVQKHLPTCFGSKKLPYTNLKPVKEQYSYYFNKDGVPQNDYYKDRVEQMERMLAKQQKANDECYVNPIKGHSSLSVSNRYGGGESITGLEMLG